MEYRDIKKDGNLFEIVEDLLNEKYSHYYIIIDSKFNIIQSSDTDNSFLKELLDSNRLDIINNTEDSIKFEEALLKVFKNKERAILSNLTMKLDNSERKINIIIEPVEDLFSEELALLIFEPISEEKLNLQNQICQISKLAFLGEISANTVHELNNQLAIIQGFAESIELLVNDKEPDIKEISYHSRKIQDQIGRMKLMVQHIKDFSRDASDEDKESKDINEIIKNSLVFMNKNLNANDIALELDLGENLSPVMLPPVKFEQVIQNIIINAQDALIDTPDCKNKKITVSTKLSEDNKCIILTISDNAKGMSPEIQKKIFYPFFTTKEIGKGTGLGLSIVHNILKSLDLNILVDSKENEGSSFKIIIPLDNPERVEDINPEEEDEEKHILVVDDEPEMIDFLSFFLKRKGFNVSYATNGAEALDMISSDPSIDLVLSDIKMPKYNGVELLEMVNERAAKTPKFIFITAGMEGMPLSSNELVKETDFIYKPFTMQDVIDKISETLE